MEDLDALGPGVARVVERHDAELVGDLELVFGVCDELLVASHHHQVIGVVPGRRAHLAIGVAADGVLAAGTVQLPDSQAFAGQVAHVAVAGVESEDVPLADVGPLGEFQRGAVEGPVPAELPAPVLEAQGQLGAVGGLEGVVHGAVGDEVVDRGGELRAGVPVVVVPAALDLEGAEGVAHLVGGEPGPGLAGNEGGQARAHGHAQGPGELLVGVVGAHPGGVVVRGAVRDAGGQGVRQVEDVGLREGDGGHALVLAAVVAQAEGLATAPEVARGKTHAQGEAEHRTVAPLEEHFVDAGLLAPDGDVHLGLVRDDVDLGLGGLHVEKAQLAQAREGILEQLGLERVAFLDDHGPAQDLVLGGAVALEIEVAHRVQLALVHLQGDVDLLDPVHLPDVHLLLGPEHDVAQVAVLFLDLVDAHVEGIQVEGPVLGVLGVTDVGLDAEQLAQPGVVVPPGFGYLGAVELLAGLALEDVVVALELEGALGVAVPFQDLDHQLGADVVLGRLALPGALFVLLLVLLGRDVPHLDGGLAHEDVLVAQAPVRLLDGHQVLVQVLLHQEVMGREPAEHPVPAGLGHDLGEGAAADGLVAAEGDLVDLDLAPFLDVEDQAGGGGPHVLQGHLDHRVPEALLGALVDDEVLDLAGRLGVVDGVGVDGELLLLDLVLQGGKTHLRAAAEVHFLDEGPLLDENDQLLAALFVIGLELDVIEGVGCPELVQDRREVHVAQVVARLQPGLEDDGFRRLLQRPDDLDLRDHLGVLGQGGQALETGRQNQG